MKKILIINVLLFAVLFSCSLYKYGDVGPAGGYIFYTGDNGDSPRYLEVVPVVVAVLKWGPEGTSCNSTYTDVGMGQFNTSLILEWFSDSQYAAPFCANFEYGGYDDWFLPSNGELELIYERIWMAGLFPSNLYTENIKIWSSTEMGPNAAYYLIPDEGGLGGSSKSEQWYVFPVRGFD